MSHAKLPPSAGKRWLHCGGSVAATADVVDAGGPDADRGTAGHWLLLSEAINRRPINQWLDKPLKLEGMTAPHVVGQELLDDVQETADWVLEYLTRHPGAYLLAERKVEIGSVLGIERGLCAGTGDLFIFDEHELLVFDAKFGFNDVDVGDERSANDQLMLYTIGFLAEFSWLEFDHVRQVIYQPKSGGCKERVVGLPEIRAWAKAARPKVLAALDPKSPRVPSKGACRWCAFAAECPELHEQAQAIAKLDFDSFKRATVEQLLEVLHKADMIRSFLNAIELRLLQLAQLGRPIPGYKLVMGEKHRVWTNAGEAQRLLAEWGFDLDKIAPRKMTSPAQAEKLVGKRSAEQKDRQAKLHQLIIKPEGQPALALASDPRPERLPDFSADSEPKQFNP